jgi:hydrogenase nickel incorporation protein HypA/HybF
VHELSICTALVRIVEKHADGHKVEVVHLDVGHLRQVIPESLRYSWEIVVLDTPLAGSVLDINHIPAVLHCRDCDARTAIDLPVFRCGCGSIAVDVVGGEELLVTSLDLTGPRVPAPPRS